MQILLIDPNNFPAESNTPEQYCQGRVLQLYPFTNFWGNNLNIRC